MTTLLVKVIAFKCTWKGFRALTSLFISFYPEETEPDKENSPISSCNTWRKLRKNDCCKVSISLDKKQDLRPTEVQSMKEQKIKGIDPSASTFCVSQRLDLRKFRGRKTAQNSA